MRLLHTPKNMDVIFARHYSMLQGKNVQHLTSAKVWTLRPCFLLNYNLGQKLLGKRKFLQKLHYFHIFSLPPHSMFTKWHGAVSLSLNIDVREERGATLLLYYV